MSAKIRYLIFDVESVTDGALAAHLQYPHEEISPHDAIARWRKTLMDETGKDFIPYTFQIPTAVVLAKVSEKYELLDLVGLSETQFTPAEIVERFWRGWEKYARPAFVTFNGRNFDIPLMELSAFRYGVSIPGWFSPFAKSFEQPRNRFNQNAHIDLCDILTNFGTTRFNGGLSLAANLIGKPGKMDVQGCMVQDMHNEGKFQEIEDYCRCDVLDTYFVFLRTRVLMGYLSLLEEQKLVENTKKWLEVRAGNSLAYQMYLENWGDWQNPWGRSEDNPASSPSAAEG
ncbi:MAG: 3'-5' exonuclease [Planctomycetia bacterium]|nr:3'-5' exonuclease [Planctomycetia bacterium]